MDGGAESEKAVTYQTLLTDFKTKNYIKFCAVVQSEHMPYCWISMNNYKVPYSRHLIDSFLIITLPLLRLITLKDVFTELSVPLSEEKTTGSCISIEFLGTALDSNSFFALGESTAQHSAH